MRDSVVAVYGVPAGERHPVKLGTGSLEHEQLVMLGEDLVGQLTSDHAPEVLRVGIASRLEGEPFVEVVEARRVWNSEVTGQWAVELWTPASSPTVWEVRSANAEHPVGPANPVCFAFPRASFC